MSHIHKEAFLFVIYDSYAEIILPGKCTDIFHARVPFERLIPYIYMVDTGMSEVSPLIYLICILFVLCFPVNISNVYKYIDNYLVKCFYLINFDDRS